MRRKTTRRSTSSCTESFGFAGSVTDRRFAPLMPARLLNKARPSAAPLIAPYASHYDQDAQNPCVYWVLTGLRVAAPERASPVQFKVQGSKFATGVNLH